VTHDCQLDKEWNQRVRELQNAGWKLRQPNEKRPTMRHSTERLLSAASRSDGASWWSWQPPRRKGHRYLPVPHHPDNLVDECVADLTYQCTIDRLDVVKVASISEAARKQLRYALIQLDALRTPTLVRGRSRRRRTIQKVEVPARDPLTVRIQLDDGNVIQLLQQPGTPDQDKGVLANSFRTGRGLMTTRSPVDVVFGSGAKRRHERRWCAGRRDAHERG